MTNFYSSLFAKHPFQMRWKSNIPAIKPDLHPLRCSPSSFFIWSFSWDHITVYQTQMNCNVTKSATLECFLSNFLQTDFMISPVSSREAKCRQTVCKRHRTLKTIVNLCLLQGTTHDWASWVSWQLLVYVVLMLNLHDEHICMHVHIVIVSLWYECIYLCI